MESPANNGEISEEWRPVWDSPRYEVSNLGRVRSLFSKSLRRAEPKILALTKNPVHGYIMVSLGAARKCSVHSLVCTAFHGTRPAGTECAHDDGVRSNNRATNLAWKTPVQNNSDKVRHGTYACGEKIAQHVLTEADAREILSRDPKTFNMHHVAAEFGVTPPTIHRLWHRKTWRHITAQRANVATIP